MISQLKRPRAEAYGLAGSIMRNLHDAYLTGKATPSLVLDSSLRAREFAASIYTDDELDKAMPFCRTVDVENLMFHYLDRRNGVQAFLAWLAVTHPDKLSNERASFLIAKEAFDIMKVFFASTTGRANC